MVSEQRRWMLASAAVAMMGLACGPTKAPDKGKGSTSDPPKSAPVTEVKPEIKPEVKPVSAVWQQVPSSAFFAMAFHRPTQSAATLRDVLGTMLAQIGNIRFLPLNHPNSFSPYRFEVLTLSR